MNVNQRAVYFNLVLMFKCMHGLAPEYLCNQIVLSCEVSDRETRFNDFNNIYVPFPRKNILKSSFIYHASHLCYRVNRANCKTVLLNSYPLKIYFIDK